MTLKTPKIHLLRCPKSLSLTQLRYYYVKFFEISQCEIITQYIRNKLTTQKAFEK